MCPGQNIPLGQTCTTLIERHWHKLVLTTLMLICQAGKAQAGRGWEAPVGRTAHTGSDLPGRQPRAQCVRIRTSVCAINQHGDTPRVTASLWTIDKLIAHTKYECGKVCDWTRNSLSMWFDWLHQHNHPSTCSILHSKRFTVAGNDKEREKERDVPAIKWAEVCKEAHKS